MAKNDVKGFFIRLPDPNTGGWKYVEIDVNRLGPEIVHKIYNRTSARDSGSSYRPVEGLGVQIDNLDVSELLACIREIRGRCEDSLRSFGEDGQRVLESLLSPLNLETVIKAIAERDLGRAEEALKEMLFLFLSGLCDVAQLLQNQRHLSSTVDGMGAVIESSGRMEQEFFFEWAEAAENVAATVEELETFETELRSLVSNISSEQQWWVKSLSVEDPIIKNAMTYLDDGESGFRILAFNHIRESGSGKVTQGQIDKARSHVKGCLLKEQQAQESWERLCSLVNNRILPQKTSVQRAVSKLETATRKFLDFRQRFPEKAEQMFGSTQANDFGLSRKRYALAERIVGDNDWAPMTCRRRIEGLTTRASGVLNEDPRLPVDIKRVLTQAQEYIKQIEEKSAEPSKAEGKGVKKSKASRTASSVKKVAPKTKDQKVNSSSNGSRVEELYELIICVAYQLTCRPHFFACSTIESMMEVLPHLNLCSREEVGEHLEAVTKRSLQKGEYQEVDGNPTVYWKKSQVRWIAYRARRNRPLQLKLTQRSIPIATELLRRYNITLDDIKAAHEKKKLSEQKE